MKKTMKIILKLLFIGFLVISFSGCRGRNISDTEGEKNVKALAICLGAHANSSVLNLNSPFVKKTVKQAIASFGFVSVISIDGKPDIVAADNYQVDEQYRGNPELLMRMAKGAADNLLSDLSGIQANDEEVDVLEALRIAVRTLDSAPEGAEKEIIVIDSGLSTSGYLDFRNNLLSADPEELADQLFEKQIIPNFEGITVKWQQLGDVYEPQKKLSPSQVAKLKEIWGTIIRETGGIFVASETIFSPEPVKDDLPIVSVVKLQAEEPIKLKVNRTNDYDKGIIIDEKRVKFEEDSDKFAEPEKAFETISVIANDMKYNSKLNIVIIGTTAGDENTEYTYDLSKRRAEMVKDTLMNLDIEAIRMKTVGMASSDPWHIYNVGTKGRLAAKNRKVVIMSADSSKLKEILK